MPVPRKARRQLFASLCVATPPTLASPRLNEAQNPTAGTPAWGLDLASPDQELLSNCYFAADGLRNRPDGGGVCAIALNSINFLMTFSKLRTSDNLFVDLSSQLLADVDSPKSKKQTATSSNTRKECAVWTKWLEPKWLFFFFLFLDMSCIGI